jgi:hypothetical protein
MTPHGRIEPFANKATIGGSILASQISADRPIRPRPGARRVCPPQRRTIAAAGSGWRSKCAGLVDAGAVGGDLVDDVVGGQNG